MSRQKDKKTKRQKDKKTKRQKDKKKRKRQKDKKTTGEFYIVMSGQFCTLAMFSLYNLNLGFKSTSSNIAYLEVRHKSDIRLLR